MDVGTVVWPRNRYHVKSDAGKTVNPVGFSEMLGGLANPCAFSVRDGLGWRAVFDVPAITDFDEHQRVPTPI